MNTMTTTPVHKGRILDIWNPEDKAFWTQEGEAIFECPSSRTDRSIGRVASTPTERI